MATSGVVTYTTTGADIVRRAYIILGHIDESGSPSAAQSSDALIALNYLVKSWSGQSDFAPGLKMWTRRRAVLFPNPATVVYTLGPNGDHATETWTRTTLTAGASGTALTVASIAGISSGNFLGVELPSGALQWSIVNGTPAGFTVTSTDAITANAGAAVYTYLQKMRKPIEIQSVKYSSPDSTDSVHLSPMTLAKLDSLTTLSDKGVPYMYLFEEGRTDGRIYFDIRPEDVTKQIYLTYLSTVEDFASAANDCDYPQVWFRALALGLAKDLAPGGAWAQDLELKLGEALTIARNANPQTDDSFFSSAT
jgi:hypothetical protein